MKIEIRNNEEGEYQDIIARDKYKILKLRQTYGESFICDDQLLPDAYLGIIKMAHECGKNNEELEMSYIEVFDTIK